MCVQNSLSHYQIATTPRLHRRHSLEFRFPPPFRYGHYLYESRQSQVSQSVRKRLLKGRLSVQ